MPLIMDEDQYMEDLFGDAEPVSVPVAPAAKGLPQRLDELYASGCCQKLAWSKWGPIAAITQDRRAANIYNFVRDPQRATWEMSRPTPLPLPPSQDEYQLQHVAWSYMGNDLAVVDVSGRIMIYLNGITLGKMVMTRTHVHDQDDEMSAVVGLHWLPVFPHAQQSRVIWAATRDGGRWNYELLQYTSPGPCNPVKERSALISLSRNGILRLLHQQPNGQWLEAYSEVESITTAKEAFTHASFAADTENSLLLITYNAACCLQLYRVTIKWNLPQTSKDAPPSATMTTSCLLKEDDCLPSRTSSSGGDTFATDLRDVPSQLTHLEFVPAAPEQGGGGPTPPTVIAAFASVSSNPTISLGTAHPQPTPTGIISRWELHQQTHGVLHGSFDQLTLKKKSTSAVGNRESLRFVRQPDINAHAAVLSISIYRYNTLFAFSLSDGSVEFRERTSLDVPFTSQYDENRVYIMPHTGFTFPSSSSYIETAISPNFCAAAVMGTDGSIQAKRMEYALGSFNGPDADPKLTAAIAVISFQYTSAVMQYQAADDIFAMLPTDMAPNLRYDFLNEIYSSLRINLDYSTEDMQKQLLHMFRTPPFTKSLSAQALLGTGRRSHRTMSAKLAWATLNIRMASGIIIGGLKPTEALRPEMAISLLGIVRWSLDLLVFVFGELIDLSIKVKGKEDDRVAVQEAIHSSTTPALLIILSSVPRVMLRMFCPSLRQGSQHALSGAKTSANLEHRSAYSRLVNVYTPCPVNIKLFEALINDVDASVKSAYATSGISDAERARTEKEMFVRCEVPEVLMPVVRRLLTGTVVELMKSGNVGRVRLHDVRWLGLSDDAGTREWLRGHVVDVIRKVELRQGTRLRRCTRCGSCMEDIGPASGVPMLQWLAASQRNCVCGGSWVLEDS